MNKISFLMALKDRLSHLPQSEVEERLGFYSEMIEDRVEEGLSEEEAVASVGSVEEIVEQILGEISSAVAETPRPKRKKRPSAFVIVLLALGCPVWLSLLVAAAAVAFSLYAAAWSVIVSLWAAFGAVVGSAVGVLGGGVALAFGGNGIVAAAMAGAGLASAGLSVFLFLLCRAATKGVLLLTKKSALWLKNLFAKKEEAK